MRPLNESEKAMGDINHNWKHFCKTFDVDTKYTIGVSSLTYRQSGVRVAFRHKTMCKWKYDYEEVRWLDKEKFAEWRKNCRLYSFVEAGNE